MPINEAQSFRLHSLSEKEEREAIESLYGVPMSPTDTQLTYEERIKMRRLLDDLDRKEAGGHKEFDLAKPPVPQYHYREFPFVMYHHEERIARPAKNHEEREKMRAAGWKDEPFDSENQPPELTAGEREEAALVNRLLKKHKEQLDVLLSTEQQPESNRKRK